MKPVSEPIAGEVPPSLESDDRPELLTCRKSDQLELSTSPTFDQLQSRSNSQAVPSEKGSRRARSIAWWLMIPFRVGYRLFQFFSLVVLLAVVSSVPIVQLASLGYMLEAAKRMAIGNPCQRKLPGLDRAGRLGVIGAGALITWLPVWLVGDYAYSADLIAHGSLIATRWRTAAGILSLLWIIHLFWATLRGGRWYHFLWPAPIRFAKEIWRKSTWGRAEDALWDYTVGLRLPSLIWLGARGAVGAIVWLLIPGAMMIIGMQANQEPIRAFIGLIGAGLMLLVLLYLPFLQVHMARENRFLAIFDVRSIRKDFKRAPWAFWFAFLVTLMLAMPLYLFRIESLPKELLWLPCLFFVFLTLPARLTVGWALRRGHREIPKRFWLSRWMAWTLQLITVPAYIGLLYLATIASWDGAVTIFLQHAFLVPVPFSGT